LYDESCLYNEAIDLLAQNGFSLYEVEAGFRGPAGQLMQADALLKSIDY